MYQQLKEMPLFKMECNKGIEMILQECFCPEWILSQKVEISWYFFRDFLKKIIDRAFRMIIKKITIYYLIK